MSQTNGAIVVEDFRPLVKNSLRGFARVRLPSGMVLHDVAVHVRNDRTWVSPPGRPAIGRDGTQMKDQAGKLVFSPTVSFADRPTSDRFTAMVLAALQASNPEAFAA